jgi:hypothetical protein
MSDKKNYAVITGDIIDSSEVSGNEKDQLIQSLKEAFDDIQNLLKDNQPLPSFDIFRCDSFQGLLSNPARALRAALFIRAALRKNQPGKQKTNWDTRLSIGVGTVDYLPKTVSEGDGPAYRNSGPVLDGLKGEHKLAIKTHLQTVNEELKTPCALLDAVISKWTQAQAEIVYMLLQNKAPKDIGNILDISRTAVHYRIKGAGWFAIEVFLQRYREIMDEIV